MADREVGDPVELSAAGLARRAEMLRLLQRTMARRRTARGAIRWGVAAPAAVLAAALWVPRAPLDVAPSSARPTIAVPAGARIDIIRDEPGIVGRYAVRPSLDPAIRIGDDELIALLRSIDCTDGLVRVEGKLLFASTLSSQAPPCARAGLRP